MGPHRKRCDKIDWLTQNCVSDSKRPSQNKRFVCKHHAVSLSLSESLSLSLLFLRPAIKVCELARLKNCRRTFHYNMRKDSDESVQICIHYSKWGVDKVCQASPLLC